MFSLTTLVLINVVADRATSSVKQTIDVSLYFNNETSEEAVTLLQTELEKIEQIENIRYISAEEALGQFKQEHEQDQSIIDTLAEIDQNPFGPTLVINATEVEQYPVIMEKISELKADELAEKIDYEDHQLLISRIDDFTNKIRKFGFIISSIFLIIAVLTVFNTIRVGIYIHRREIAIMRLVGANNWFIRLPFIIEGLLYAFFSCILFWVLIYILMHFFGGQINSFFSEINFNVSTYLSDNMLNIFGFEFIIIAVINMLSAMIAMGRYLRV